MGNCITINFNKENDNICSSDTLIFDVIIKANKTNYVWTLSDLGTGMVYTVGGNSGTLVLNGNLPETDGNGSFGNFIQIKLTADSSNNTQVSYESGFEIIIPSPKVDLGGIKSVCPGTGVLLQNMVSPGTYSGVTYNYEWYLNENSIISIDPSLYVTSGGKYFLNVTENSFQICSTVRSVDVVNRPKPNINLISQSGKPIRCADKPLILEVRSITGSSNITTINFVGPNKTVVGFNSINIEPTSFAAYKAIAIDNFGCKDSATINITINQPMTLSISGSNTTLCKFTTLSVNALASGGSVTGIGYKYTWLPILGLENSNSPNQKISPVLYEGINYTITGTDAANCTAEKNILIKKAQLALSLANYTSDTVAICAGTVLNIAANRKWGQPNFTFAGTSFGTSLQKITDSSYTTEKITKKSKIFIQVKDGNNCIDKDSLIVNVIPSPIPNIGDRNKIVCKGNTLTVNIAPTITGTFTYTWTPNNLISNVAIANPTFKPSESNTETKYYLTVTDIVSQCATNDSVNVATKNSPIFAISQNTSKALIDTPLEFGSKSEENDISYVWNIPKHNPASFNTGNIVLQFDSAKVYDIILIGTNVYGCIVNDTLKIRVRRNSIVVPYIPNIFIPSSSDPKNNSFRLFDDTKEIDEVNFTVKIYNHAGQVVYATESYNEMTTVGWKGDGYSTGVYTYLIRGIKVDDTEYEAKGGVTLLK